MKINKNDSNKNKNNNDNNQLTNYFTMILIISAVLIRKNVKLWFRLVC